MKYSTLVYYLASQRLQCYINLMVTDYKPKLQLHNRLHTHYLCLGYQKPRMMNCHLL